MNEALSQHRRQRLGESEALQLFKLKGFKPGEPIGPIRKLGVMTMRLIRRAAMKTVDFAAPRSTVKQSSGLPVEFARQSGSKPETSKRKWSCRT